MKKLILLLPILLFSIIINSQNWGEQILNQPNREAGNTFGFSVDIDGDYAVIGAPGENERTGSAHIYKKDVDGNWKYHQKIDAYVGKHSDEYFGYIVAIQGDYIFVSAPTDRLNEVDFENPAGSVMIYTKDANNLWTGVQRLYSSDIRRGDYFGSDIAIDGDFLVVGAYHQDYDANNANVETSAGAAYIFQKDINGVWNEIQKITPTHRDYSDNVGSSVSISGDYIVLASENDTDVNNANTLSGNGSAFIYKKDVNNVWNQVQKLKPTNGISSSFFGFGDVSISGDFISVGAKNLDLLENNTWYYGHVYLFKKDVNDVWIESQIVKVPYPASNFGTSVSLDNNLLLVSAPESRVQDNGANISGVGISYLFAKNVNDEFVLAETIQTSQVKANSTIGGGSWNGQTTLSSIAIDNNHFVIGASSTDIIVNNNDIYNVGSAYISGNVTSVLAEDISWTGNVNTNWNNPLNWIPNTIPTETDDVILNDVARSPIILTGQNEIINNLINFENLSIESGGSLTISGNLDQRRAISINSSLDSNGSLILKGNQTNPNPADSNYQRYVSGNNWHLISSPATGIDIDVLAAATQLAEGQNNNRGIGFYDNNANPRWSYYQDGANGTGDFIAGKGYSLRTSANAFLILTGKLKATDLSNYIISENLNSWNLVGNPYPAFINANVNADANENFLSENADQLDPAFANIYLWNPSTTSYEPVGNGLGAKYIAPGQGFFVKSKNGGGTIDINKTMLTHQIGDLFLKQNQPQKIVLTIDDKTSISETTIAFKESMTKGLDVTYDAAVFSGESRNLSLYTHLLENNENVSFAIQFLPKLENNEFVIPLGVSKNENSEITFSLQESTISSDMNIYLEDKLENRFTEISKTPNYTFSHQKATNEIGRFYLHIQKNTLSLENVQKDKITIYKDSASSILINGVADGTLNIYSITGKNVMKNRKINENEKRIQLPTLAKGIYLFEVKTSSRKIIKKIIF